ncbi:hypothetical protein ACFQU1_22100 [Chelatococcus sp. GCM10030263]
MAHLDDHSAAGDPSESGMPAGGIVLSVVISLTLIAIVSLHMFA